MTSVSTPPGPRTIAAWNVICAPIGAPAGTVTSFTAVPVASATATQFYPSLVLLDEDMTVLVNGVSGPDAYSPVLEALEAQFP